MKFARHVMLALLAAACLGGCYTTTIRSGKPAAPAKIDFDGHWHHGILWGTAELSGPYDLSKVCPHGWAEITTEESFVNGFLNLITYSLYSPQSVTIRCAQGAGGDQGGDSDDQGGDSDDGSS